MAGDDSGGACYHAAEVRGGGGGHGQDGAPRDDLEGWLVSLFLGVGWLTNPFMVCKVCELNSMMVGVVSGIYRH